MEIDSIQKRFQALARAIESSDGYTLNGGPVFRESFRDERALTLFDLDEEDRLCERTLSVTDLAGAVVCGDRIDLVCTETGTPLNIRLVDLSGHSVGETPALTLSALSSQADILAQGWQPGEPVPDRDKQLLRAGIEAALNGGVSRGVERLLNRLLGRDPEPGERANPVIDPRRWPQMLEWACSEEFDGPVADSREDLVLVLDTGERIDLGQDECPAPRTFGGFDVDFRRMLLGDGREAWVPNRLWYSTSEELWRIVISHANGVFTKDIRDSVGRASVLMEGCAELFSALAQLESIWSYSKRPRSPGRHGRFNSGITGVSIQVYKPGTLSQGIYVDCTQSLKVNGRHQQVHESLFSMSARGFLRDPEKGREQFHQAIKEAMVIRRHWRHRRALGGRVTQRVYLDELDPAEIAAAEPPSGLDPTPMFELIEQERAHAEVPQYLLSVSVSELMDGFPGHPLFDHSGDIEFMLDQGLALYPSLRRFLHQMPEGAVVEWDRALRLLGRHKDTASTFNRYKAELQRFLLYLWVHRGITFKESTESDMDAYLDWLVAPPSDWCSDNSRRCFRNDGSVRAPLPSWRPFIDPAQLKGSGEQRREGAYNALSNQLRRLQEML